MDWSHLFMPGDSSAATGPGSFDAEQSLLLPTSDFFENLPRPVASLPPRPPSVHPDLEPAPLFSPGPESHGQQQQQQQQPLFYGNTPSIHNNQQLWQQNILQHTQGLNALGLQHLDSLQSPISPFGVQQQQQQQQQSHSSREIIAEPNLPQLPQAPNLNTLFDSNEETYLNSFLNSFDVEGFDLGPYLASPQPMANFSSRPDYSSIGIGMGIGAGMMGGMDDSIPHLSLDESQHDSAAAAAAVAAAAAAAHGLTRMTTGTSTLTPNQSHFNSNTDNNNNNTNSGMAPMRRQSFFEYGLGGTSHLSLGNVMNEEMHKVSSWLIQNQDHHSISPITPQQHTFASIPTTALPAAHRSSSERQFMHPHTTRVTSPLTQQQMQYNRPPSESDMSIKRKASQEQLELPRKSRGPVWSPMRESPMSPTDAATQSNSMSQAAASAAEMMAADPKMAGTMFSIKEEPEKTSVDPSTPDNTEGGKRREEKKNTQRVVLTEEERRANHIASEQRRRNQIRQGYAELMSLVTTLRDPALGNHPGTAQSTPSKAVILSHAVQFIRGLEEGNRLLRKRIEGTPRHLAQPMGQRPFQVPTPMHRKQQPHTANMGAGGGPESTS